MDKRTFIPILANFRTGGENGNASAAGSNIIHSK